jgi:hypothetical protein
MKKSFLYPSFFFIAYLMGWPLLSGGQDYPVGYAPVVPIPGYIITKSGDTITGKIKCGKFTENFMSEISFTGPDGIKIKYTPDDLVGMGICLTSGVQNGLYFGTIYWDNYECRPSPKQGIMIFMNRFTNGRIKVFMHRGSAQVTVMTTKFVPTPFEFKYEGINVEFSLETGLTIGPEFSMSFGYFETRSWYSSYYVEKDNAAMIKVEKGNYATLWSKLFGDCGKLSNEIKINPELIKFSNFLIVTEIYNQICKSY